MEDVKQFIKGNKNLIKINDLNQLVEDDNFNDLDDESKNQIFFMAALNLSTKDYKALTLKETIEDFEMIIEFINNNDYLHDEHECFESLIKEYLNNIDDLLKPSFKSNQEDFIKLLHKLIENIEKINFTNDNCKKGVINELKNLQDSLSFFDKKVGEKYKDKFRRHCNDLDKYIKEQEKDNNNVINKFINENEGKEIKQKEENYFENFDINNENILIQKNKNKNDINDNDFLIDNNNDINKVNNKPEKIINDKIMMNFRGNEYFDNSKKNEIIEINKISDNNYFNEKNINDLNEIKNDINFNNDDQEFSIINNNSRISALQDSKNSLNDSRKYYESMMPNFSLADSINKIIEAENEKEEEENVQIIYKEIDNFIDDLNPMFTSKDDINEEKLNFIKKSYLKSENLMDNNNNIPNININFNSVQNINNNINISNSNIAKKKKKKGKKKKKQ